jgi:hypothetical protein
VHEWPVAVVALGSGTPALEVTGPAVVGQVDAAPLEFPLVTAAQRAGERDELEASWVRGAPVKVSDVGTDPLETVVLARGSQKLMDPDRGLPDTVLRTSMGAALRGVELPHFVAVHDVDGVEPGVYRWPDLSSPRRAGAMRNELYLASMEQGLARDAAFVVIAATDVGALDDREYREAQLAAGLVEGRLHLLAYALGASACGMTFIDGEVPALLGEPLDGLQFTCVAEPENRAAAGGPPGAPTSIARSRRACRIRARKRHPGAEHETRSGCAPTLSATKPSVPSRPVPAELSFPRWRPGTPCGLAGTFERTRIGPSPRTTSNGSSKRGGERPPR